MLHLTNAFRCKISSKLFLKFMSFEEHKIGQASKVMMNSVCDVAPE
jgi:hypothetical protein